MADGDIWLTIEHESGSMTRGELRAAVVEYGFDHRPEGQVNRIIDTVCGEVTRKEPWAFRATTRTGSAPLEIADLGIVDTVRVAATGERLRPIRRSELVEADGANAAGPPQYYWLDGDGEIAVWPESSTEITVEYFSRRAWAIGLDVAEGDIDEPRLPTRFQELVIRLAVADLFDDATSFDSAAQHRGRADVLLEQMREGYLIGQGDEPDQIRFTGAFA